MTDIPLTPLIDTALTLLVIFIVIAPSMKYGLEIRLPKANIEHARKKEEIIVVINKQGDYLWNGILIKPPELVKKIAGEIATTSQKTVFIKADKQVIYEAVVDLFELLSTIDGIEDVILPTEKR